MSTSRRSCNRARCQRPDCEKFAQTRGLCKAHGGGSRCRDPSCHKLAQSRGLCIAHGGGRRCQREGCAKLAQSKGFCISHGGGRRCTVPDCEKFSQVKGRCKSHSKLAASTSDEDERDDGAESDATMASPPPPTSLAAANSSSGGGRDAMTALGTDLERSDARAATKFRIDYLVNPPRPTGTSCSTTSTSANARYPRGHLPPTAPRSPAFVRSALTSVVPPASTYNTNRALPHPLRSPTHQLQFHQQHHSQQQQQQQTYHSSSPSLHRPVFVSAGAHPAYAPPSSQAPVNQRRPFSQLPPNQHLHHLQPPLLHKSQPTTDDDEHLRPLPFCPEAPRVVEERPYAIDLRPPFPQLVGSGGAPCRSSSSSSFLGSSQRIGDTPAGHKPFLGTPTHQLGVPPSPFKPTVTSPLSVTSPGTTPGAAPVGVSLLSFLDRSKEAQLSQSTPILDVYLPRTTAGLPLSTTTRVLPSLASLSRR